MLPLLRYVIAGLDSIGATVLERTRGSDPLTCGTPAAEDAVELPEVGTASPSLELYQGTDLARGEALLPDEEGG